jgi:hypothetical protein
MIGERKYAFFGIKRSVLTSVPASYKNTKNMLFLEFLPEICFFRNFFYGRQQIWVVKNSQLHTFL